MANRITYSCNSPDGGSDMDVSDSDEGEQIYAPPVQPKPRPHEGMVVSLHNFMKKDSWGENSIGIRAENKLNVKKQPRNPTSYASIAKDEDSDSDSSFHTAPNSPEREIQDIEPGQITEPVSFQQSQLLLDCEALEKALKENEERERLIDEEIKKYKDIQENIRIQLLAHKVRNSIARNRKPVKAKSSASVSNDIVKNDPVIEKMDISTPNSIEQPVSLDSASLSKEKGKSRMDDVEVQPSPSQVNKRIKPTSFELCIQKRSPCLATANQPLIARKSKKKATGANPLPKRPVNPDETVKPLVPAVKRVMEIAESSGKKKKKLQVEPPIEHGNRLIDAVIDKPFSKRYVLEENLGSESPSDSSVKETKRQRKAREKEEMISEEERKLIELDDPPYPGHCIQGRKELSRTAHRAVLDFLNTSSTTLKEMRLILLNLKEASIEQNGRLTIEQEEFTKVLIRRIMQLIESYMTLSDEAYARSLRKLPPIDLDASLPDHYYGNIRTLDFSRPDLSHHQLYKIIRHFDSITNTSIKRKAQQFLLSSGRTSTQQILRTCDPAIRDDADATLSGDETDYARRVKLLKREKLEQHNNAPNENGKLTKKEKRKVNQELKKEMLAIDRKVADEMAKDIDQMADQIATDMHLNKKARLDPNSSVNKPVRLNVDLPTSSSAPPHEKFINTWKPKPGPETVRPQQSNSPSSSFTVVKPVHAATKDVNTKFTKATSPTVDKSKAKKSVPPVVNNAKAKKSTSTTVKTTKKPASPVEKQKHTKAPIIIIDDTPSPSQTPISKKKVFKVTDVPVIIDDNLTSKPTIVNTHESKEDTSLKTQENPMQFQPYKSALNSLGLSHTTPLPEPKSASLCSAESSGGVCKVKNCNFTHFRDYI